MNIKALVAVAGISVVIAGVSVYSRRDTTPSTEPTPTTQTVKVSPIPKATPKRALKPNEHFLASSGLYVQVPEGLNFRQDPENERIEGFYIEVGPQDKPTYQMYGLYQLTKAATEKDLEMAKTEMDPKSIKEVTIAGYKGIEGAVAAPKARYLTLIIKDGKLLTFTTNPVTPENKVTTEQILSTLSFQ